MRRRAWLSGFAACAFILGGCVERRYVVYTDPPGALVVRNGVPLTASPADDHFEYYGKYHFTLIAEGYETLQVDQNIPAPWYEYPPFDFITENLLPWKILDKREFTYRLEPRSVANTDQLLSEGQNLRNRGIDLGGGSALPQPAAPTAPAPSPGPQSMPPTPVPPPPGTPQPGTLGLPNPGGVSGPQGGAQFGPGTALGPPTSGASAGGPQSP
jgi:hypothetical protein